MISFRVTLAVLLCFAPTLTVGDDESPCPICNDNPDAVAIESTAVGMRNVTCAEIGSKAIDLEQCDIIDVIAHVKCGCPAPHKETEVACPLCADGTVPHEYLGVVIDNTGTNIVTCFDILLLASSKPKGDECSLMQSHGVEHCGCPAILPGEDATSSIPDQQIPKYSRDERCNLCTDGSKPSEAFHDSVSVLGYKGGTCDYVHEEVTARISSDNRQCPGFQATLGFYCGCDYRVDIEPDARPASAAISGLCRICGDQKSLTHPYREIQYGDSVFTCAEAELEASVIIAGQSSDYLVDVFGDCETVRSDLRHQCCDDIDYVGEQSVSPRSSTSNIDGDSNSGGGGGGSSMGVIIGVVVVLIALAIAIGFFVMKRRSNSDDPGFAAPQTQQMD